MRLTFRPTRMEDLETCVLLIRDRFVFDGEAQIGLVDLWREVVTAGCVETTVVEDEDRPAGSRIVGFRMSVFVTDEFVHDMKTGRYPYVGRQVLTRWSEGRSPLLSAGEIRRANSSDGLNVLGNHYGWPEQGITAEDNAEIRRQLFEAFAVHHRGYRLKEYLQEVYGESTLQDLLRSGPRLLTDYEDSPWPGGAAPPPHRHPFLVGMTRDDVMQQPGHFLCQVFSYTPPRFNFRPDEQDIVRHALRGETDEELSRALSAALVTIKKRWAAIYDRVADTDPQLLAAAGAHAPEGRRGAEKRRHLLNHLRAHPEELRPILPQAIQR
jgi:hypothetical protein